MTFPKEETDARGRRIHLIAPPQRIVSLVPSQTELLAHLGLDARVVGITRYCVSPPDWRGRKQDVGGTRRVDRAAIRALSPDLVLANLEENARDDVLALDSVAPVFVTEVGGVEDALGMISAVGRLTGRSPEAAGLVRRITEGFVALPPKAPVRTAYLVWRDPWMTPGGDTFIHDVLARGGLVNVFGARRRYPALSDADLTAADPQVVLLPSEPYPFTEADAEDVRALLPRAQVRRVGGEVFSWYGSRLLEAPAALRRLRATLGA